MDAWTIQDAKAVSCGKIKDEDLRAMMDRLESCLSGYTYPEEP